MKRSLLVGTPCFGGQVTNRYTQSLLRLQKACFNRDNVELPSVAQWGDSLITRARQGIVTHFLGDPSATHLLLIDGDRAFSPEQVFRLLEFDADISAAAWPDSGKYSFEPEGSPVILKDGFVKSRYVGTDLMLIKRSALEAMIGHYPGLRYNSEFAAEPNDPRRWSYALFNCLVDGGNWLSEDYSFCRRWTEMGGEIWVDPSGEPS